MRCHVCEAVLYQKIHLQQAPCGAHFWSPETRKPGPKSENDQKPGLLNLRFARVVGPPNQKLTQPNQRFGSLQQNRTDGLVLCKKTEPIVWFSTRIPNRKFGSQQKKRTDSLVASQKTEPRVWF